MKRYMQGYCNGAQASANMNGSASASASTSTGEKGKENFDEYLTNVGADIAAFLDPFGKFVFLLLTV